MIDRMIYEMKVTTPKAGVIYRWVVAGSEDSAVRAAKGKYPKALEITWSGKTGLLVG